MEPTPNDPHGSKGEPKIVPWEWAGHWRSRLEWVFMQPNPPGLGPVEKNKITNTKKYRKPGVS